MLRAHATASTPPLAPSRWPIMLFVLDTINFLACAPNHYLHGFRFRHVALAGACAVGVDVAYLVGVPPGVRDRFNALHCAAADAVLVRIGNVERVRWCFRNAHFGVDGAFRAFARSYFFKHENAGALAQHEAVAALVERSARPLRVVVSERQRRRHAGEPAQNQAA